MIKMDKLTSQYALYGLTELRSFWIIKLKKSLLSNSIDKFLYQ